MIKSHLRSSKIYIVLLLLIAPVFFVCAEQRKSPLIIEVPKQALPILERVEQRMLAAFESVGLKATFQYFPNRRGEVLLREGKADGSLVRGHTFDYLPVKPEFFSAEVAYFTLKENGLDGSELGPTVATVRGFYEAEDKYPQREFVFIASMEQGLELVRRKRADGFIFIRQLTLNELERLDLTPEFHHQVIFSYPLQLHLHPQFESIIPALEAELLRPPSVETFIKDIVLD